MSRPTEIRAGDSYSYTVSISDYPASAGWTLRVVLQNATYRVKVNATTNADGESYDVTLSSANTDDLATGGTYQITEAVEKGSGVTLERHTTFSGSILVRKDIVTGTAAVDARSDARIILDTITATIKANVGKGHDSMSIAARAIGYRSWEEMLKARSRLQFEVKAEEASEAASQGLESNKPMLTRFTGVI